MPLLTLITNVKLEDAQVRPFVSEFSKKASEVIGKPEAEFSVDFTYNPYLTFGGTFEPAIRLHVMSLWNTNAENSVKWSKAFSEFFTEKLGVPNNRGHMSFIDPGDAFIGFKGTSVAALVAASK
ncbi:Tautomerase/MIF superfamily [Hygrophoropsis aurantiaca]|uniref:Tautomerase/MIF superfamily n=1 Tax=Hygrophoropsis aurantiaca TaxID=72124 RepID=A0ACB8AL98_9AGAM|nr:Tautomerase/MIF superfamily [Hygrophoropsis aurantiaca]